VKDWSTEELGDLDIPGPTKAGACEPEWAPITDDQPPRFARVTATPFTWRDPQTIPPRRWLFGNHAIRGFISVTGAPGGVGKTALLLAETIALATGRDLLSDHLREHGRVWYIGLEDPFEEYQRRVAAIAIQYGLNPAELTSSLFLDSGRDQNFIIAHESRNGIEVAEPIVASVIDNVRDNQISLIVVDPFVASHRVDESANMKIEAVARLWAGIAEKTGTAVELVHHVRKGTNGAEPSADDLRGASALVNAARSVRVLSRMTKEEAESAGVEERHRFFRVTPAKANLIIPSDVATWRQLVSVPLGNGSDGGHSDFVGVVTPWKWPSAFDGLTTADLRRVQAKIADGEWRESSQAANWAGLALADVLGLDAADKMAKDRIKRLLKQWLGTNMLRVVTKKDEARHERKFVEVGDWAA
jgi:hypothetical protein